MIARVYVDGFNLYHRRLRNSPYKWLDLVALSEGLIKNDHTLEKLYYFTADVSPRAGDEHSPMRQSTYMSALKTSDRVEIVRGNFLSKTIHRPLVGQEDTYVYVRDSEEKGSDVNLACQLILDAARDRYDTALVFSQDTDLLEAYRIAREEFGKTVWLVWHEENTSPGKKQKRVVDKILRLRNSMLTRCQFPNVVRGKGGRKITKPDYWASWTSMK